MLIAGVDEEPVRLALLELAAAAAKPYIDLGTDVIPEEDGSVEYGGQVCFSFGPDGGCLSCLDQLNQVALRWATMTPDQRREDEEISGVSRQYLDEAGPAVVSLNGVVASLGVTEFAVWRAGLRNPARVLTYRGSSGGVRPSTDAGDPRCPYCLKGSRTSGSNGSCGRAEVWGCVYFEYRLFSGRKEARHATKRIRRTRRPGSWGRHPRPRA